MVVERIQKIIAAAGICSRRHAEALINRGDVVVNGVKAKLGDKADSDKDKISVSGKLIKKDEKVYYLLNKPKEYLSENKNEFGKKTIYDLPSVNSIGKRVIHVGRLDFMSEGMLFLTNDGDFANKIIHPKYELVKTYYVRVEPNFNIEELSELNEGVSLDGDDIECKARNIGKGELELDIHEGKNRIVRRIMEYFGKKIFRLVRIQIGKIKLGILKSGEVRKLTPEEIKSLIG
jgi:23S rRNA pseudouridine2605 synthase